MFVLSQGFAAMAPSFLDRTRRTTKSVSQRRRTFLGIENLEERTVLAGNVTASVTGGYLYLFGDAGDNQISVTRNGSAGVTIASLDGTTKINGSTSLQLGSVTNGIIAITGNGDDVLEIKGSSTAVFRTFGSTSINTGNGDDIVRFTNYSTANLSVATGAGEDQLYADLDPALNLSGGGLRVAGAAVISMGTEDDIVSIRNSVFGSNLVLDASLGNDSVDIRNTSFVRLANLYGSLGTDTLNSVGNTFRYAPYISGFEIRTSVAGPLAANDSVTVAEGGTATISVLTNDTATSGTIDASTVTIVQQPTRGTATVNANGTITYQNSGTEFAVDSFTYTVRDSQGNISNAATVAIVVTPVNDLPVATSDSFTVAENSTTTLNLGVNDIDAEGRLSLNSLVIVQQPTNGTVTLGTNGRVTYTQNGAEVTSDSFTYTIADLDGGVSLPVIVNLTITPVNDAPVVGTIAAVTTNEDTATGNIAVNVSDAETAAANLTVTAVSSNPTLVPNANIVVGGSGSARTLVITPATNASGTATITVSVSDGTLTSTQTFLLTVNAVNDAPTIVPVADITINEDTASSAFTINVGDIETPNNLTVTATSSVSGVVAPAGVSISGSGATRTVVVTPVANAAGSADITLTVSDGTNSVTDIFTVTVNPVNDLPTVSTVADITAAVGTAIAPVNVTVGDVETLSNVTVTATSSNQALIANSGLQVSGTGSARVVTITPVAGASGTANITLTVNDGAGGTVTEVFQVTLNAAPTISAIADVTINEDANTGSIAFTINDAETAVGSLQVSATSSNTALVPLSGIQLSGTTGSRTVIVTPVANASGSSTITLTVRDANGLTATESFVVNVMAQNDLPTLSAVANVNVNEDATIAPISVSVGDIETSLAALNISATSSNQLVVTDSGISITGTGASRSVVITPIANASGTTNITLTLVDTDGGVVTRTFTLNVAAVNDAPVAASLAVPVLEGGTVDIDLGAAATDVDGTINLNSIVITQQPVRGSVTVNADGTVTYTHNDSETTTDSFKYTIKDNLGLVSAAGTVNLTVTPVNDAPVVPFRMVNLLSNASLTINLLANVTDPDGPSTPTISGLLDAQSGLSYRGDYGQISVNANGTLTYSIDPTAIDELLSGDIVTELIGFEVTDGIDTTVSAIQVDLQIV
jgi:VCBS repeat-containing protein